jgi:cytochrome c-type biogenesis protein CcmH
LLLDRAEGRISHEEFEERQAAADSVLLDAGVGGSAWPIVAAVIGAGAVTAAIFFFLGTSPAVAPVSPSPSQLPNVRSDASTEPSQPKQGGDLRDLAKPLAQKLAANPGDGPGWLLLARTYIELHQFKEAETAFEEASRLVPADASMFADWAGAHVSANNGAWTPKAKDILKRALAIDSTNPKTLTLAIAEAESRNDTKQAAIYRKQVAKLPPSGTALPIASVSSQNDGRTGTPSAKLPSLPTGRGN